MIREQASAEESRVFVISGPGGVGKSTIAKRLATVVPELELSTSWTTRAPRPGEDPKAYCFVNRDVFMERVEAGGFLEWAQFAGNLYGTPIPELTNGVDLLLEIDVQGARQVKQIVPNATVILVVAPSWSSTEARLRERGDDEVAIERRLEIGRREEAEGRILADDVVVNDDLDATVNEMASIIAGRRRLLEEG